MGKYIIKLERGETAYKTVNSNGKPMIQLLAPTPYTEPDLEQVKADAYLKGLNDGQGVILESTQNNAFNNGYKKCLEDMEHDKGKENSIGYKIGYKKGYIDGLNRISDYEDKIRKEAYEKGWKEAEDHYEKRYDDGYDTGLSDAWEAARTLWNTPNRKEIFGHITFNTALTTLTAQEAIEKIRQYEQEQQFHVGDEIETQNGFKGFVISADDKYVYFVNEKGEGCVETMMAAKTGRHFPEIAEVLEKMRGE